MTKKVLVAIADGIEELEAVTIIDCMRRAQADVAVAAVNEKQIVASRGVKIVADCLIGDCKDDTFDIIVLPGGMPGAEHLRDCPELIKMLKDQAESSRLYAAICASPAVVLQHYGLLARKKATCHPSLAADLNNWQDEKIVVDGNCITSQGPATAIDFSLKLIEILYGKEKSDEIAKQMLA